MILTINAPRTALSTQLADYLDSIRQQLLVRPETDGVLRGESDGRICGFWVIENPPLHECEPTIDQPPTLEAGNMGHLSELSELVRAKAEINELRRMNERHERTLKYVESRWTPLEKRARDLHDLAESRLAFLQERDKEIKELTAKLDKLSASAS